MRHTFNSTNILKNDKYLLIGLINFKKLINVYLLDKNQARVVLTNYTKSLTKYQKNEMKEEKIQKKSLKQGPSGIVSHTILVIKFV